MTSVPHPGVARVVAAGDGLAARLAADPALADRLAAVVAGSDALARHLENHPDDVLALRERPRSAARLAEELGSVASADELRLAYRRALLPITAEDLTAADPVAALPATMAHLTDLADAVVSAALRLAIAQLGDPGARIGIVAMGKAGARELNYVSDVDIIAIAEPEPGADPREAMARAGEVVALAMRICSAHSAAGTIWEVDAALRPEGKAGPLVRTLESMAAYYDEWAKPWEFQALLKARPMAGDRALAGAFCDLVSPGVWRVGDTPGFVQDTQAMRRRVVSLLSPREAGREIKLSAGGLRDVEFTVQLLQLIHGRADDSLRVAGTLPALDALVAGGYVGRAEGSELARAYAEQRLVEHRLQLLRLRRTHVLPTDAATLRRLSQGLGTDVEALWRRTSALVRRLHQRLFYSPLLAAVASLRPEEIALTHAQAGTRLAALGYGDPTAALRHIEALTGGLTRKAQIQRQLLPALLGWFAEAPAPDAGLLAFRRVSEALGDSPWYLRALRDEGAMAQRLASLLAGSRFAVDLLLREPSAVGLLADEAELAPRPREELLTRMRSVASRHGGPQDAIAAIRAVRRRELLRLAAGDALGLVGLEALGRGLADLAGATVDAALEVAVAAEGAPPVGVLALGRWGGGELSFASDLDASFVVADGDADAVARATAAVTLVRRLLAAPGPDPALTLDADLRPEGRSGPLVRSVSGHVRHWAERAQPWEAQALLRAAHGAGAPELTDALLTAMAPLRYPDGGPTAAAVAHQRRLKARMETERLGRGTDPARHLKLGPGGLADVEWTVQLLQLRHAAEHPGLRTTGTLAALAAEERLGLMDADEAADLREAWELASRARNAVVHVRGRGSDTLPTDSGELSAVAWLLGHEPREGTVLLERWRRAARRAHAVVERRYWSD